MEKNHEAFAEYGEKVLRQMRIDAGLSQMEIANRMDIAEHTVHKWENGKSCPDVIEAWAWYRACGLNQMPYVMAWKHPERYSEDDRELATALFEAITALDKDDKARLLYVITGNHGSFFPGVLQLVFAHLHLPLRARIGHAVLVATNYNTAHRRGTLVHTDRPMPNMELLDRCINAGQSAVFVDKESYIL